MMKLAKVCLIGLGVMAITLMSERVASKEVVEVVSDYQRFCALHDRRLTNSLFDRYLIDLYRHGRSVDLKIYDDFTYEGSISHSDFQAQAIAYQKFRSIVGINGADGRGGVGIHIVNVGDDYRCEAPTNIDNAWATARSVSGTLVWHMAYLPLSMDDPVSIGHEAYHIFINNNADLEYKFESGALNEAISDAIGVAFQIYYRNGTPSTLAGVSGSRRDWQIGAVRIMRDMISPNDYNQPDHMSQFQTLDYGTDYGGVHINSGIVNHAFYLLSEGGQHRRLRSGPDVQGVGLQKAVTIFHNGAKLMTPTTNFVEARAAFQLAAAELYGYSSPELAATVAALDAVGIASVPLPVDPTPTPPTPPAPTPSAPTASAPAPAPSDPTSPPPASPPEVTTDPIPSPGPTSEAANKKWLVAAVAAFLGLILLFGARRKPFEDSTPVHAYAPPAADSSTAILDGRSQPVARRSHGSSAYQSTERFTAEPEVLIGGKPVSLSDRRLNSRDGEVFGRSSSFSHHRLDSQRASRRHMRIRRSRSGLMAMDLNTSNGTTLNGKAMKPMKEYSLSEGDKLRIARDLTIEVNSVV